MREVVNRNMVEPTPHTFDEAQLQIYTLMHRDSYPRFVNSPLYKTLARLSSAEPPAGLPATPGALQTPAQPATPAPPATPGATATAGVPASAAPPATIGPPAPDAPAAVAAPAASSAPAKSAQ